MEPDTQQLSALFSNISSQIRLALTNFHLAAGQLTPVDAREQDAALDAKAAILDQSYYRLLRLVNNLSDVARLHSHQPLPMRNDDVVELVQTVCRQAETMAFLLDLQLEFLSETEHHICAIHTETFQHLLFHLLSNAFKYTPPGGSVTVELKINGGQILLVVNDTGCGIDASRLPHLFDGYLQESAASVPPHGLGLGLSLCHKIAEEHGGSIMAESKPGKGTRFTVFIPNRQVEASHFSDVPNIYGSSGFNDTLMALSDALPAKAFLVRNQD